MQNSIWNKTDVFGLPTDSTITTGMGSALASGSIDHYGYTIHMVTPDSMEELLADDDDCGMFVGVIVNNVQGVIDTWTSPRHSINDAIESCKFTIGAHANGHY